MPMLILVQDLVKRKCRIPRVWQDRRKLSLRAQVALWHKKWLRGTGPSSPSTQKSMTRIQGCKEEIQDIGVIQRQTE